MQRPLLLFFALAIAAIAACGDDDEDASLEDAATTPAMFVPDESPVTTATIHPGLSATPLPTPTAWDVRADGVLTSLVGDFGPEYTLTPDGVDVSYQTCITDANVLIKDERVHEVVRKGHLVVIDVGELISGVEELPDYDEVYVSLPVYRDNTGSLIYGHRECWPTYAYPTP